MNAKIQYPKDFMTRAELLKMGIPEVTFERAVHCEYASEFAEKTGEGRTCKWLINTKSFEEYRRQGVFK